MQASVWEAHRKNLKKVVVEDLDTGLRYSADFEMFARFSIKIDRGYGEQLLLPDNYWQVEPFGERQMNIWETLEENPTPTTNSSSSA